LKSLLTLTLSQWGEGGAGGSTLKVEKAYAKSIADRFFVKNSFRWDEVKAFVKSIPPGTP
jgi:hypothetical protein